SIPLSCLAHSRAMARPSRYQLAATRYLFYMFFTYFTFLLPVPQGCMLQPYTISDTATCLNGRSVVFIGDSITRGLFFTFMHLTDPHLPEEYPTDGDKHADYQYTSSSGSQFTFIWD